MTRDNKRLTDIKQLYHELEEADSISECFRIKGEIDKLEKEEKEII